MVMMNVAKTMLVIVMIQWLAVAWIYTMPPLYNADLDIFDKDDSCFYGFGLVSKLA